MLVSSSTPRLLWFTNTPLQWHWGFGRLPMGTPSLVLSSEAFSTLLACPPPSWCHAEGTQDRACFAGPTGKGPRLPEVSRKNHLVLLLPALPFCKTGAGCLAFGFNSSLLTLSAHQSPHLEPSPLPSTGGRRDMCSASSCLFQNVYFVSANQRGNALF